MKRNMSFVTWILHVTKMLENQKRSVLAEDYVGVDFHAAYKLRVTPKSFVKTLTEKES